LIDLSLRMPAYLHLAKYLIKLIFKINMVLFGSFTINVSIWHAAEYL